VLRLDLLPERGTRSFPPSRFTTRHIAPRVSNVGLVSRDLNNLSLPRVSRSIDHARSSHVSISTAPLARRQGRASSARRSQARSLILENCNFEQFRRRAETLIAIRRNAIASFHVVKCPTSLPFCITAIKTSPRRKPRRRLVAGEEGGPAFENGLAPCGDFGSSPRREMRRGRVSLSRARAHAPSVPRRSFLSLSASFPFVSPPVTGPQQFATYRRLPLPRP